MAFLIRNSSRFLISNFRQTIRNSSSVSAKFEEAKLKLNTLQNDVGNDVKLKIYAYFKQATLGKNTTSKPGAFNFVGQAKWNAWHDLGDISEAEAMQGYIDIVNGLAGEETSQTTSSTGSSVDEKSSNTTGPMLVEEVKMHTENNVTTITLNRPQVKNALTNEIYFAIPRYLKHCAVDPDTHVVVLTGAGDYYCSGNDLNNFMVDPSNMKQIATDAGEMLKEFVASFIDFPKPLFVAVNGPAIGVSVTSLGLCDMVYASDKATFSTPFASLGQSPEGVASLMFPRIMGPGKAFELMLLNRKLDATEAERYGLITRVFPHESFHEKVKAEAEKAAKLPLKSMVYSKQLMRDPLRSFMHETNAKECERLVERWTSEDCLNAIMQFFSNKK